MKICLTVIEILTLNKWSSEVYHFQCFLTYVQYGVDFDVSIDAVLALAKQKQNGV